MAQGESCRAGLGHGFDALGLAATDDDTALAAPEPMKCARSIFTIALWAVELSYACSRVLLERVVHKQIVWGTMLSV